MAQNRDDYNQNRDDYKVILRRYLEAGYKKPAKVITKAKEAVFVFGKKVKNKISFIVTSQEPPRLPKTKELQSKIASNVASLGEKNSVEGRHV